MQKLIQRPACLDDGLHVLKTLSFPTNRALKMREKHQLFFGLRLVSNNIPQSKPKYSSTLADFFIK